MRAIYSPGLWLQSLTTRPPDHDMLEVSITALERCSLGSGGRHAGDRAHGRMIDRLGELTAVATSELTELMARSRRPRANPELDVARLTELGASWPAWSRSSTALRARDEAAGFAGLDARVLADDPDPEVRAMAREEITALEARAAELEARAARACWSRATRTTSGT